MTLLYDRSGKAIQLGVKLGEGGEGQVHVVVGTSDLAAKVYLKPASSEKSRKIALMISLATPELLKISAWPQEALKDKNGQIVGLLMPRIDPVQYRQIHELTGPKTRLQHFPQADWAFLIHVARNLASAFAVVHERGQVVGDVNQNNIYVSQQGTVRFIDTDSFQIITASERHLCEVGVPEFTPPELQGQNLHGVTRSPQHDLFGLATLIFQLLFMGRWPFAGRGAASEMQDAIGQHQFVFGRGATAQGLQPPPFCLPTSALPGELFDLFEQAFGNDHKPRPTAQDWIKALEKLRTELKTCAAQPVHKHWQGTACPWCELEKQTHFQISFFNAAFTGAAPQVVATNDINELWMRIQAVPRPTFHEVQQHHAVAIEVYQQRMAKVSKHYGRINLAVLGLFGALWLFGIFPFWLTALGGLMIWIATDLISRKQENPAIKQQFNQMDQAVMTANQQLHTLIEDFKQNYDKRYQSLASAKQKLTDLPQREKRLCQDLENQAWQFQLDAYLRAIPISSQHIPGIGPKLIGVLQSYGITSIYDIDAYDLQGVPGFGQKRINDLLTWRKAVEQTFRFNPAQGVPQSVKDGITRQIQGEQRVLLSELQRGAPELYSIAQNVSNRTQQLQQQIEHLNILREQAIAQFLKS